MADTTKNIFTAAYPVRPLLNSHQSNSLPSTPRQHALDFQARTRSPSPRKGIRAGSLSPRSVCSDSNRALPSLRTVAPTCRFMSTQTSRRRIPYSIGADPLEDDAQPPKAAQEAEEEVKLSADMQHLYKQLLPSEDNQSRREQVVHKLSDILSNEWPDKRIKVSMFGSSGNLLFTTSSDVDVCVTMTGLDTVCSLAELLAKRGMKRVTCVHAKAVPIVKIWDPELQLACDLNVNNHVAIQNTHLVRAYMEIDERVRILAMVVKYWTNRRVINEASGGTLSSYCWTLLVINYLQMRSPPILPIISLVDTDGISKKDFETDVERFRDFGHSNGETIGELLFQFYRYYGYEIDYETAVVSVRSGKLLSKKDKKWHFTTNNRLCVEEPFNIERNLGNTADDTAFRGIHMEIRQAFSRVAEVKDISLIVCEKFEYPLDEPRTVFERPQAQPRPVLSRSASQTGRGGRHAATMRAPKQHYNQRSSPNSRRASSATAYSPNVHPIYQNGQVILQQGTGSEYYIQGAPIRGLHDQLSQLSHQLSVEEGKLRFQQMLVSQAQLQAAGLAPVHGRGINQRNLQQQQQQQQQHNPHRGHQNGYSNSRPSHTDNPLINTAQVQGSFRSSPRFEHSVPNTQVNSHQSMEVSSSAPDNAPLRRGLQRTSGPLSPGASRSQSQPARSVQGQFVPVMYPSGQYAYALANGQIVRPDQLTSSYIQRYGYPTHIVSPYPAFQVNATEALPREYLGYGIGGSSQATMPYVIGPSYEDMQAPARRQSPPQGRTVSPEYYTQTRTSSPAGSVEDGVSGVNVPVPILDINATATPLPHRPVVSAGPLIVNGSTRPAMSSSEEQRLRDTQEIQTTVAPQAVPVALGSLSDTSILGSTGIPVIAQVSYPDAVSERRSLGRGEVSQDSSTPAAQNGMVTLNSLRPTHDERSSGSSSRQSPQSHAISSNGHPAGISPEPSQPRMPRAQNEGRPVIPPLDLGHGLAERTRQREQAAPPGLSPVHELRTPSPSVTRKSEFKGELHVNGSRSTGLEKSSREQSSMWHSAGKENTNGVYSGDDPSAPAAGPIKLPIVQPQQTNAWQSVRKSGKKGKGRDHSDSSEAKSRGEPLPALEFERKGG